MTKIIGVDLDEVLAESLDHVLEFNDYKFGSYELKKEDIKYYYIHKMEHIDLSIEDSVEWFKIGILYDIGKYNIKQVPGAKERLLELKSDGYVFKVITARTEEHYGDYTRKWVEINYPNIFDGIIFADHFHEKSREKSEICLEEGINIMIEDNYDYAIDLAKKGIKTYLLEKPWNNWQGDYHENIIRIKSWDEVKK